jgi:hypothetical protein
MRSRQLIPVSFLLFLVLLPVAFAQNTTTYTINLQPCRWSILTIGVQIPSSPTWLRNATLYGINEWNIAQKWFVATYYPNSTQYTLTSGGSQVTIQLVSQSQMYGENIGQTYNYCQGKRMTHATIQIWQGYATLFPDPTPYATATLTHELGIALGLGETNVTNDLLNHVMYGSVPSTLDLFALWSLANKPVKGTLITLPSSIPYILQVDVRSIPEFGSAPIVLICALLSVFAVEMLRHREVKRCRPA